MFNEPGKLVRHNSSVIHERITDAWNRVQRFRRPTIIQRRFSDSDSDFNSSSEDWEEDYNNNSGENEGPVKNKQRKSSTSNTLGNSKDKSEEKDNKNINSNSNSGSNTHKLGGIISTGTGPVGKITLRSAGPIEKASSSEEEEFITHSHHTSGIGHRPHHHHMSNMDTRTRDGGNHYEDHQRRSKKSKSKVEHSTAFLIWVSIGIIIIWSITFAFMFNWVNYDMMLDQKNELTKYTKDVNLNDVIHALYPFQYELIRHPLKYIGTLLCSTDDAITKALLKHNKKDKFIDKRRPVMSTYVIPLKKPYKIIDYANNDMITSVYNIQKSYNVDNDEEFLERIKSVFDRAANAHTKVEEMMTNGVPSSRSSGTVISKRLKKEYNKFKFSKAAKEQKKQGKHKISIADSKKIPKIKAAPKLSIRTDEKLENKPMSDLDKRYQTNKEALKMVRQEGIDKYIVSKQELKQREANIQAKKKAKLEAAALKNAPKPPPEHINWHDEEDLLLNFASFIGNKYNQVKVSLKDKMETAENYIKVWNAENENGELPPDISLAKLRAESKKKRRKEERRLNKIEAKRDLLRDKKNVVKKASGNGGMIELLEDLGGHGSDTWDDTLRCERNAATTPSPPANKIKIQKLNKRRNEETPLDDDDIDSSAKNLLNLVEPEMENDVPKIKKYLSTENKLDLRGTRLFGPGIF